VNKAYLGSTLDSFFEEKGNLEEVRLLARKKLIAEMVTEAMVKASMNVSTMSRRMHTSRAVVQRILNPEQTGLTLDTLERAAHALGHELVVKLVPIQGMKSISSAARPAKPARPARPARNVVATVKAQKRLAR
jgi:antitoxin HicB